MKKYRYFVSFNYYFEKNNQRNYSGNHEISLDKKVTNIYHVQEFQHYIEDKYSDDIRVIVNNYKLMSTKSLFARFIDWMNK